MAFNTASSSTSYQASGSRGPHHGSPNRRSPQHGEFDIIDWYPEFRSCHKYFLDHAQYSEGVQALAAFINIQLPFQKNPYPVLSSAGSSPPARQPPNAPTAPHAQGVSLVPYIRRLVATGHDIPGVLHGFFGDDWAAGIGALHEVERRNYLFAAKSSSWLKMKQSYDMNAEETVPFLAPLKEASEKEIQAAEAKWSEWLAMQDWMVGPRAPELMGRNPRVKRESNN